MSKCFKSAKRRTAILGSAARIGRRNFEHPVVNIDAGESYHELHCSWNPIPLKRFERSRFAELCILLFYLLKQSQNANGL